MFRTWYLYEMIAGALRIAEQSTEAKEQQTTDNRPPTTQTSECGIIFS